MKLSCHPAIISPQELKVCASLGLEFVKKDSSTKSQGKNTNEFHTFDSDDDLSCPTVELDVSNAANDSSELVCPNIILTTAAF